MEKTIKLTEKEVKNILEKELNKNNNENIDEIVSIDSETAEKDPDLVKKLQDKIGNEDIIQIKEEQIIKLIKNHQNPKISKNKLLETLNLK